MKLMFNSNYLPFFDNSVMLSMLFDNIVYLYATQGEVNENDEFVYKTSFPKLYNKYYFAKTQQVDYTIDFLVENGYIKCKVKKDEVEIMATLKALILKQQINPIDRLNGLIQEMQE